MKRGLFGLLLCGALIAAGCVSPEGKIARERNAYLLDPSIPRYGYDGKLTPGGRHYFYLFQHDSEFGDFLLREVPKARDARVVVAALTFFTSKKPDRRKFDKVVASLNPALLDQEVDLSGTDVIMMVPLREWIDEAKKRANQTPEPTAMLVTPRAGARVAPSTAVAHL
jgi:hypothetical protein